MEPTDRWRKRRCKMNEKFVCWATLRMINKGEIYYEYNMNEMNTDVENMEDANAQNIVVCEKEYFKQALNGFKGFRFYEK